MSGKKAVEIGAEIFETFNKNDFLDKLTFYSTKELIIGLLCIGAYENEEMNQFFKNFIVNIIDAIIKN